jgi:PAS domain S-box-containing protein
MDQTKAENLREFEKMIAKGKATWWEMFLPSGDVVFGDQKTTMLGYQADQFSNFKDFTELLHPDDYSKAMQAMRDHLDGKGEVYKTLYRIKTKEQGYITFYDYGRIVEQKGEKIKVIGFVFKIEDSDNYQKEVAAFESLVDNEEVSLFDLFARAKE